MLLDADVLARGTLGDLLAVMAENGLFEPLWSERILEEATRAIQAMHPDYSADRAAGRIEALRRWWPDSAVTGYADVEADLLEVDPGDRHVAAAAVRGGADVLVTKNVRHFPAAPLAARGVAVEDADDFLAAWLAAAPESLDYALSCQLSVRRVRSALDDLLTDLALDSAPRFAAAAATHFGLSIDLGEAVPKRRAQHRAARRSRPDGAADPDSPDA
ncbi:MAG: PIN domain-containing protein [Propionibacteriaceae bacterium]|nr:PIN domain-containing protein [Propionibacteriaceae bacterium]